MTMPKRIIRFKDFQVLNPLFFKRGQREGVTHTTLLGCVKILAKERNQVTQLVNSKELPSGCVVFMYGAICVCVTSFRAPMQ